MSRTSHGVQEDWRDLGNGYVAYYDRSFGIPMNLIDSKTGKTIPGVPGGQYREVVVESCASGKKLIVPTFDCTTWKDACTKRDVSLNIEKPTRSLLDEAASAQSSMTFDQLTDRFRKFSKDVRLENTNGYETCACQVAYPKLRGKKVKYQYHSEY